MFSTSLDTTNFYSVLELSFLLHDGMNRLTIWSSHRCGGLPSGHLQSFGIPFDSFTSPLVTSEHFEVSSSAEFLHLVLVIASFTQLRFEIISLRYTRTIIFPAWIFSCICAVTSLCSFFVGASHFTSKTMLRKKLACRVLSSFDLSTSFIVVNAFYSECLFHEISALMSRHIFTIRPKYIHPFTSSISKLPTIIPSCCTSWKNANNFYKDIKIDWVQLFQ